MSTPRTVDEWLARTTGRAWQYPTGDLAREDWERFAALSKAQPRYVSCYRYLRGGDGGPSCLALVGERADLERVLRTFRPRGRRIYPSDRELLPLKMRRMDAARRAAEDGENIENGYRRYTRYGERGAAVDSLGALHIRPRRG